MCKSFKITIYIFLENEKTFDLITGFVDDIRIVFESEIIHNEDEFSPITR